MTVTLAYRFITSQLPRHVVLTIAVSVAGAGNAQAFDVKGLSPGMRLESIRKQIPQLQCKPWMAGPYEQTCDVANPQGNLSTLANRRIVSIRIMADAGGVAHVLNFSVSCGIDTEQLVAAFQGKWGNPTHSDTINRSFAWVNKSGDEMHVMAANGRDNVCQMVDVMDAIAVKWNQPIKAAPSKDL